MGLVGWQEFLKDLHFVFFPVLVDDEQLALFNGELYGSVYCQIGWFGPTPTNTFPSQICVRFPFDQKRLVNPVNGRLGAVSVALERSVRLGCTSSVGVSDSSGKIARPLRIEHLPHLPIPSLLGNGHIRCQKPS